MSRRRRQPRAMTTRNNNNNVLATAATVAAAAAIFFYYYDNKKQPTKHHAATVERLTNLVAAERKGRTRAERQLGSRTRNQVHNVHEQRNSNNPELRSFTVTTIAIARTLFVDRRGCPRQGSLTPTTVGWLDICKHIPRAAFESLDQFSHVWVTFIFDRNTNIHKASATERTFKAKIRPPLLGGTKVGLFATRSPHRPNPIGLTLCKLDHVDLKEGRVYLSGIDLCDGTPVLDIKPYVCHDRPEVESLQYAKWIPTKQQSKDGNIGAPLRVRFRATALEQIKVLLPALHKAQHISRVHYPDVETTTRCITEILQLDIRGLTQKRGADGSGMYTCRLGVIGVQFTVQEEGTAWVETISEGSSVEMKEEKHEEKEFK